MIVVPEKRQSEDLARAKLTHSSSSPPTGIRRTVFRRRSWLISILLQILSARLYRRIALTELGKKIFEPSFAVFPLRDDDGVSIRGL